MQQKMYVTNTYTADVNFYELSYLNRVKKFGSDFKVSVLVYKRIHTEGRIAKSQNFDEVANWGNRYFYGMLKTQYQGEMGNDVTHFMKIIGKENECFKGMTGCMDDDECCIMYDTVYEHDAHGYDDLDLANPNGQNRFIKAILQKVVVMQLLRVAKEVEKFDEKAQVMQVRLELDGGADELSSYQKIIAVKFPGEKHDNLHLWPLLTMLLESSLGYLSIHTLRQSQVADNLEQKEANFLHDSNSVLKEMVKIALWPHLNALLGKKQITVDQFG